MLVMHAKSARELKRGINPFSWNRQDLLKKDDVRIERDEAAGHGIHAAEEVALVSASIQRYDTHVLYSTPRSRSSEILRHGVMTVLPTTRVSSMDFIAAPISSSGNVRATIGVN
jgi:hypothetical protein